MVIQLTSTGTAQEYTGTNERGQQIALSGKKQAVSPMESVLMAVAACSAIDIEILLGKMRQVYSKVDVIVEGVRADAVPAVFTSIHVTYRITGHVSDEKARKAASMSLEKYCSVAQMLISTVAITHEVHVLPQE